MGRGKTGLVDSHKSRTSCMFTIYYIINYCIIIIIIIIVLFSIFMIYFITILSQPISEFDYS